MKLKLNKILALVISIIIIMSGCKKNIDNTSKQGSDPSIPADKQESGIKTIEITDQEKIEKLWQEYLYYSITTVGNAGDFNSAKEINPVYVAQFCWYMYTKDKGAEDLELLSKDTPLKLFPLETVLEYAKRYFNITSLDVSQVSEYEYSKEKNAFIISVDGYKTIPGYTEKNPWGIHIGMVTKDEDGTITATMESYDTYETKRVTLKKTLILKQHPDGSMYFAKGKWDYVNNNLVAIDGSFIQRDKIQGFEGHFEELSMVCEVDGRLILAYKPYDKGKTAALMFMNPDNFTIEKTLELRENLDFTSIKQAQDKLIICLDSKIMTISKKLEKLEEIPLPKAIRDKINRKPKYDSQGFPDTFFGGYDVSGDLTKLVYSDEKGVKLYNLKTNMDEMLYKTEEAKGDKLLKYYYHWKPRFVAKDKKILIITRGYEYIRSHTLYDIENRSSAYLDIGGEISIQNIYYDTGLLMVNMPTYNELTQKSDYVTLYLDFLTGIVSELELKETGDTGFIIPDYYSYVGQKHAAFVTSKIDNKDRAKDVYYIHSLDLKTKDISSDLISITAGEPHILGVLGDGRIVFWYIINPAEMGICITK